MALPATDDFNRANSEPVSGDWTTSPGLGDMRIFSNEVLAGSVSGPPAGMFWDADSFNNDQFSECIGVQLSGSHSGPTVRMANSGVDADMYVAALRLSTIVRIKRIDAGVVTQLGASFDVTDITGVTIRIEAVGTQLEIFRAGVSQGTRTDATYSSGSAGIVNISSQKMDDWGGGNVGAPPPGIQTYMHHYQQAS